MKSQQRGRRYEAVQQEGTWEMAVMIRAQQMHCWWQLGPLRCTMYVKPGPLDDLLNHEASFWKKLTEYVLNSSEVFERESK